METKPIRKKASLNKIASNRRNARRSTGPRTAAGKRRVRWNALQHGLFSAEVVLPLPEGPERPEQFAGLLDQLRRDLRPQGTLEEMLVENIAACYWRLRRVLRAESGEIRRERATVGLRELERSMKQDDQVQARNLEFPGSGQFELLLRTSGVKLLMRVIERVQQEVQELGYLSPEAERWLGMQFGEHRSGLAARCRRLSPPVPDESPEEAERGLPQEERTPSQESSPELAALLAALEEEKNKLARDLPSLERQETQEWLGRMDSFSVPSKPVQDRMLRYEAGLHRELHRSIRQLQRLQMQRKGLWTPWGPPRKLRNKAKQVPANQRLCVAKC